MSDIETAKTTEQMGLDEQDLRRLLNMSNVRCLWQSRDRRLSLCMRMNAFIH